MENLHSQGIDIPRLGFGTFRMKGEVCQAAVESAIGLGYHHIDTGAMYGNEEAVGAAIAAAGQPRGSLHVTTKVWHDQLAPAAIRQSLATSLGKLRLDYVDLFMVHWPTKDMDLPAIFDTMLRLREEGLIRAMGVCNFTLAMVKAVVEDVQAPLACHQLEYHVLLNQDPMMAYLRAHGVIAMAHVPMAQGRLAEHAVLATIGQKHGASAAQIALAWLMHQPGVGAVPKAQSPEKQQANLDALSIRLDADDLRTIAALPKNQRVANPPHAPAWD